MTTTDQINLFLSVLSERNQHLFAIWCAERALKLVKNSDPRSVAAIEAKKKWLDGKISDEDLEKARDIAWAAYAAADAYAVAYAAVAADAVDVAVAAAYSADTYSADAAYSAAAYSAAAAAWAGVVAQNKERTAQLCKILTMLGEQVKK